MLAERLYQAIIDKVSEHGLDWDVSAKACGFDPEVLLECFQAKPRSRPLRIYDYLGREQINKTAEFLGCPKIRIFFLADVFPLSSMQVYSSAVSGDPNISRGDGLGVIAKYMQDITESKFFGSPGPVIDELIGNTHSESLKEACAKVGLPFKEVSAWRDGQQAALKDLHLIQRIADSIQIGIAPVLISLSVVQREDFLWNGNPVDPFTELQHALDVDIW